jgi:hypothetical protein
MNENTNDTFSKKIKTLKEVDGSVFESELCENLLLFGCVILEERKQIEKLWC